MAYLLSRTKFYWVGALLRGLTNSGVTFAEYLAGHPMFYDQNGPVFGLKLPALISGQRVIATIGAFNLLKIALLPYFDSSGFPPRPMKEQQCCST